MNWNWKEIKEIAFDQLAFVCFIGCPLALIVVLCSLKDFGLAIGIGLWFCFSFWWMRVRP